MFKRANLPAEASIFAVFVGIAVLFEILGWFVVGKSFLGNVQRLEIIILQVCIFGIIAVGVTQVIITSGIDLSGGAVLALSAMVAASFAQSADAFAPIFPQF
jgi:inositol transport system permease protein